MSHKIWITWEDHRRSRELSAAFSAKYVFLSCNKARIIRYPVLGAKTFKLLLSEKPSLVFCQNPSIVLASLLCILKILFKYSLIVDRHSNFKFHTYKSINPKWIIFHWLSKLSLRTADLTIVTNQFLKSHIETCGGRSEILPDKLPSLKKSATPKKLLGRVNYVFVSTFSEDEPIHEMLMAAKMVDSSKNIYITGNYKKYKDIDKIISHLPSNVTLTGFLSEADYQALLHSADVVIVITTQEYTLTCGAYEAVSLEKPMILGDTDTIREYFSSGALYTTSSPNKLAETIEAAEQQISYLKDGVVALKATLIETWNDQFKEVQMQIADIEGRHKKRAL